MKRNHLLALTLFLSMASIIYELMVANTLGLLSGHLVLWQSLTVGIYIASLGVGVHYCEKSLQNKPAHEVLYKAELWLSFLGILSVVGIMLIKVITRTIDLAQIPIEGYPDYYQGTTHEFWLFVFTAGAQVFTFLIGYFSGHEIPCLIELLKDNDKENQESKTNLILGVNYIGGLLGTVALALWLHPTIDLLYTSFVVGLLNYLCALFIHRKINFSLSKVQKFLTIAFVPLFIILATNQKNIQQIYLKTFYFFKEEVFNRFNSGDKPIGYGEFVRSLAGRKDIFRDKSLYQYIDIIPRTFFDGKTGTQMHLDGHYQFDSASEPYYHEAFTHIPILGFEKEPKNVLVLGAGDGLLIRELLKYDSIEQIDHIELDIEMINFSHNFKEIRKINKGSLFDKRVKRIIVDGFYYLRNSKKKYDAVYIDFPYPHNYNLAKLYSVEFYSQAKNALAKGGFIVADAPIFPITYKEYKPDVIKELNSIIFSTAKAAGYKTFIPIYIEGEGFIIVKKESDNFNFAFYNRSQKNLNFLKDHRDIFNLKELDFPRFRKTKKYVNSIFKPTIINKVPADF